MNRYTDNDIEHTLKKLSRLQPGSESIQRMNHRVRGVIAGSDRKHLQPNWIMQYVAVSAAILLLGIGLLFQSSHIENDPGITWQMPQELTLSMAQLNAVFNYGGLKALDQYLEKIESTRQPRAETITLQEIMNDL